MAKPALVLVKRFTYRGTTEEWSNKYHFAESPPINPAAWKTLADAVAAAEKLIYTSVTSIVRAYGYDDGDSHSVCTIDYAALGATIPGTFTTSGAGNPGDVAAWIRWSTSKRTSKGKPVYARKYYHDVYQQSGFPDQLISTQKTAFQTFGDKLKSGTIPGFTLCLADGTDADTCTVSQNLTTRTLKRRGKRPPT